MPERFRAMVLLGCWGGLRRGELFGLRRWGVVVDDQLVIVGPTVTYAGGRKVEQDHTKTDAGDWRHVVLPKLIMDVLVWHLDTFTRAEPDAYVFAGERSGGSLMANTVYRHWHRARAAIGRPRLTMHDLRHSGATISSVNGSTLAERMDTFGWSSIAAAQRYDHSLDPRKRQVAERINAGLDEQKVIGLHPRGEVLDVVETGAPAEVIELAPRRRRRPT